MRAGRLVALALPLVMLGFVASLVPSPPCPRVPNIGSYDSGYVFAGSTHHDGYPLRRVMALCAQSVEYDIAVGNQFSRADFLAGCQDLVDHRGPAYGPISYD